MAAGTQAKHEKPLLRGVSHEIAAAFAFTGGLALTQMAHGTRATVAAIVYGASLFLLFATSALYHRPRWSPRLYVVMRRLDHAAVWAGALAGVVFAILWPRAPKWLNAALYVALGWAVIPVMPELAAALGPVGIGLLAGGGVLYSVGAVIYALRRPDPFPTVFGYHEIFHVLVIVAAVFHYAAVVGVLGAM